MHMVDLERLASYLDARSDVVFAVVFGSGRDGAIREEGDLDIGVLFRSKPSMDTLVRFMTEAAEVADFDVIDLVDLHNADPILAFEALSGRFLCKNDRGMTAEFTSLISREYEDIMRRYRVAA